MQRSLAALAALAALAIASCGMERLPDPIPPLTATLMGTSPPAETTTAAHDEAAVAEERSIVNDPAVVAAAEKIKVLQGDQLECQTELLGLVEVHEPVAGTDRALAILRRKAAHLGAEAVVGVELHGGGSDAPARPSGMAVRCKDLIKGRAYDVIGRIEVQGAAGKEDDADRELLERAGLMRADLVIDIGYAHGEGGGTPTKVWGTAIRFR